MNRESDRYRRALLAEEIGTATKRDGLVRVCLIYPNRYHVGMSNLGFHTIYRELNRRQDTFCERGFAEELLLGYSLETGTRLSAFDILAFSVSFELDYLNVLRVLRQSSIPIRSADRDESSPLVVMGGPCALANPEPMAEFVDLVAVGEGEELVHRMMNIIVDYRERRADRSRLLAVLSAEDGFYVPKFYQPVYSPDGRILRIDQQIDCPLPVRRVTIPDINAYDTVSAIVTPNTEFRKSLLLEISRGCPRGCRFCLARSIYRPRVRRFDAVARAIESARGITNRIGLVAAAVSDHPDIDRIVDFLLDNGFRFSVSSLRPDPVSESLLRGLGKSRQRTITFAPEVASDRLARMLAKPMPPGTLFEGIDLALKYGLLNVRLYFMIGLPGETDEDVEAIVSMAGEVRGLMMKRGRSSGRLGTLTLSVNPFVPKPFTALERGPMADADELKRKLRILARLKKLPNVKVRSESLRWAGFQAVIARGDRRVGRLLVEALDTSPAQVMAKAPGAVNRYLGKRESDEVLPWHVIGPGLTHVIPD